MADDPTIENKITSSAHLIESANQQRRELMQIISASQKLIDQSREVIARLDETITRTENP